MTDTELSDLFKAGSVSERDPIFLNQFSDNLHKHNNRLRIVLAIEAFALFLCALAVLILIEIFLTLLTGTTFAIPEMFGVQFHLIFVAVSAGLVSHIFK